MKRVREEQEREGKREEGWEGGSEGERGSHVGRGDRGRCGVKRGR